MRKKLKFEETCGDENSIQPIYEFPLSKYSAEEIIKILLTADKVCVTKPASVCNSAIYVVDVRKLKIVTISKKMNLAYVITLVHIHNHIKCIKMKAH